MHTIRLDVSNDIYDKVMFILKNLPKNKVKLQLEKDKVPSGYKSSLTDFFQSSPLVGAISLDREQV